MNTRLRSAVLVLTLLASHANATQERSAQSAKSCAELLMSINTAAARPTEPRGFVLAAVRIPDVATRNAYEIRFDDGEPLITTDLVQAIGAASSRTADGRPVYFDVSGLPALRQVAFEKSLEIAAASKRVRTRVVKDLGPLGNPAEPLKDVTVRGSVEKGSGSRAGQYTQSADATVGRQRFAIRVTSRIKQVVVEFFQRMRAAIGAKRAPTSTISIVNDVRTELANKHGLSEDEIIVEFSNQMGQTLLVELELELPSNVR